MDIKITKLYTAPELAEAYAMSYLNKAKFLTDDQECGCYYCLELFQAKEIKQFVDKGKTAVCPLCGIDTVIYQNEKYPIDINLLAQLNKKYFDN